MASDRTGSGKTIAYSLPIIEKFRKQGVFGSLKKKPKFMILCPTRELALQVHNEIVTLKHHPTDFRSCVVYGGSPIHKQIS